MKWVRVKQIEWSNFRSFVGRHVVSLPETGLVLVKGANRDTGGSSAAGKTSFLLVIQHLMKICPYPSTELQSWFTEDAPETKGLFTSSDGDIELRRGKGATKLKIDGNAIKGGSKIVEARLDEIIGLDDKLRRQVTYRGQRKPGMFLSMSDPDPVD